MKNTTAFLSTFLGAALFSGCVFPAGPIAPNAPTVGKSHWAVLKCKYSDTVNQLPKNADQTLDNLFNGGEGMRDYFNDVSYGAFTVDFDIAPTWTTMGVSLAQDKSEKFSRYRRTEECIKASRTSTAKYDGIIVTLNVAIDSGYSGNVLLDPGAWNVSFAAHEMLHHLGLDHSWDTSDRKNSDWSAPGEYFDYWDIMSAMAIFGFSNTHGFTAGPNVALPFKLLLGWVTAPTDVTIIDMSAEQGVSKGRSQALMLRPYSEVSGAIPLGACIDHGDADRSYTRYCAEYRVKSGWDRAIPEPGVLIHFLKDNSLATGKMTVVRDHIFHGGETYVSADGGVKISVQDIGASAAHINIEY